MDPLVAQWNVAHAGELQMGRQDPLILVVVDLDASLIRAELHLPDYDLH